ncbi:cupin domain-containing protein [Pseudarthrobacter albicanus]|uniref:cupin domain-containing protein n=1 Tax=Pseudarthrobacter albicanus TaxID=2823873 RepID=UPI001BAC26BF|nr:hypothetical protein [Pseudarthrobacter albicanus]
MRDRTVSIADDAADGAPVRFAVRSSTPEEASEAGGRVYYPHRLDIGRSAADFQMRLKAINLGGVTIGLLEYGTPVRITTGELESAYQVNFPLFGRLRFSQGNSVVLGAPGTAAIHGPVQGTGIQGWSEPTQMLGLKAIPFS